MVKAFELNKDDVNDEIPAPMADLYQKPNDPQQLKDGYRMRFRKT